MIKLRMYNPDEQKYNEHLINFTTFPDQTPYLNFGEVYKFISSNIIPRKQITVFWFYENMVELFNLEILVDKIREITNNGVYLDLALSYLPNARMDRINHPERDVFTLKTFCKHLNAMLFNNVYILDPHSNVSEALITNYNKSFTIQSTRMSLVKTINASIPDIIIYPDAGSEKRYTTVLSDLLNDVRCDVESDKKKFKEIALKTMTGIGKKNRAWTTGEIKYVTIDFYDNVGNSLDINTLDPDKEYKVLIIDDICSKGGTFYYLIKAIEKMKQEKIKFVYDLYVTHLESNFLDGDLYKEKLLNKLYTTNSLKYMKNSSFNNELVEEIFQMEDMLI